MSLLHIILEILREEGASILFFAILFIITLIV